MFEVGPDLSTALMTQLCMNYTEPDLCSSLHGQAFTHKVSKVLRFHNNPCPSTAPVLFLLQHVGEYSLLLIMSPLQLLDP